MARLVVGVALAGAALAGCSTAQQVAPSPPTAPPSTSEESTATSTAPSMTREVPPQQRRDLAGLSAAQLCELISPEEIRSLAFEVNPGVPREVGIEPPARGCGFAARSGHGEVLIGAQPEGFADLGTEEVELGRTRGTQAQRAGTCTVYAPVAGATLQLAVITGETDPDQCATASQLTQYVLAALTA